jgi:DNA-binding transcriptional ArsR family regulator
MRLVGSLSDGRPRSIAELTRGSRLTRQAVTKHIRILERAGLLRSVRAGRESRCELDPGPMAEARAWLDSVSRQWDVALAGLKAWVEES